MITPWCAFEPFMEEKDIQVGVFPSLVKCKTNQDCPQALVPTEVPSAVQCSPIHSMTVSYELQSFVRLLEASERISSSAHVEPNVLCGLEATPAERLAAYVNELHERMSKVKKRN